MRILGRFTPTNEGRCFCIFNLEPINSWRDVLKRHNDQRSFKRFLGWITDETEDWTVDILQCRDCGRFWAHEDCGSPWVTKSLDFLYFIDTDDPMAWLHKNAGRGLVLHKLQKDEEYQQLIWPLIRLDK